MEVSSTKACMEAFMEVMEAFAEVMKASMDVLLPWKLRVRDRVRVRVRLLPWKLP